MVNPQPEIGSALLIFSSAFSLGVAEDVKNFIGSTENRQPFVFENTQRFNNICNTSKSNGVWKGIIPTAY